MRLMTFAGSRCLGASIFSPDCFFFSNSLSAVLRNFFILNVIEKFVFFPDLIRISQCHAEKTFAAWFECDDVLARGEDHPRECHHEALAD